MKGDSIGTKSMSKKDYWYWNGRLEQFDDLSDGAWWQSCQDLIGGYDKFMSYLEAGKLYDPYTQKEPL